MKKLNFLILGIVFLGCKESKIQWIGQEIIEGKVSATQARKRVGRSNSNPKIWVQNAATTQEVEIPFEYEGRWKVGDSCLLIIEKYKEIKDEK